MASKEEIIRKRDDLGYIKNPHIWAAWLCPIKRDKPGGGYDCAYMFGPDPVIRHGNVWGPREDDREERFESHEAIIAAGWRVD